MTQFELPITDFSPATRRSRLAVLSLVLSVVPVASALGVILAVISLVRIRGDPHLEGRMLAWTGLVVGTIVSVASGLMGYALAEQFRQLVQRPGIALKAAMDGDGATFRAQMTGPGAEVTSPELFAWTSQMRQRFGEIRSVTASADRPSSAPAPGPQGDQMTAAFIVEFERERVPALVLFAAPEGSSGGLLQAKIRRLILEPAQGARIVFPDDESAEVPSP
jgi:hypothetical protein